MAIRLGGSFTGQDLVPSQQKDDTNRFIFQASDKSRARMGLGQSPGSQLDPHFISQKPDEARDKFTHKPVGFFESLIRLVYK